MRTDKEREPDIRREMSTCVHFNGVHRDECKAGVNYHDLMGRGFGCFKHLPCLKDRAAAVACKKAQFPTRDEAEREVEKDEATLERVIRSVKAAKDDAKARGFRAGSGGASSVKCPNCVDGTINYSVASINGHMHAACTTKGCSSWME